MTTSRDHSRMPFPAVLMVLAACAQEETGQVLPPLEDTNVLIIVIDTMGAGHMGCLNPELDTTPRIDALAEEGVLFERAHSTSPWTQPSVASLLTGLTPSRHETLHLLDKLAPEHETLAEILERRGYRTAGVISHFLIDGRLGYGQGFEVYDQNAVGSHKTISSPQVTEIAVEQLRKHRDDRFFLFVHYFDPHSVYRHHPDFDRTSALPAPPGGGEREIGSLRERRHEMAETELDYYRQLYREEIAFTDHHVGVLLDELEALGLRENTLVVLTADHGEEFMEHGWLGHTRYLYDTLIHVPLIFRLPGTLEPRRVEAPVSIADVAPTLIDLLGGEDVDVRWDGRSLRGPLSGGEADEERMIFSEVAFLSPSSEKDTPLAEKEAFLAAVTKGRWKLIHDVDGDRWELYDLKTDPGELEDQFREDHPVVKSLRKHLESWEVGKIDRWERGFDTLSDLSEEDRQRLKDLGYIDDE